MEETKLLHFARIRKGKSTCRLHKGPAKRTADQDRQFEAALSYLISVIFPEQR